MPKLTIEDVGVFEVEKGKRLVNALEDNGARNLHRCGGYAKCTTCRVEFIEGEPEKMTEAEAMRLMQQDNLGEFRLSCQCKMTHDMHVKPLMTLDNTEMDDPGPRPEEEITPEPVWVSPELVPA